MKEGQNRRSFLKRIPRRRFVFFLMLFLIVMTTITLTFMNDSYSQDTVGTVWDGVSESIAFSQGNGSSSNPYLINDPSDFAYLVHLLNDSEATNYNNKYYALATDLDFGGHSLSSISTTLAFQGTIDGQGHTIRNLEVEQTGETAVGLFGNLENATIQNLNLEGIQIEAVSTNTPLSYGVLAGTITHSHIHNVSIRNTTWSLDKLDTTQEHNLGEFAGSIQDTDLENIAIAIDVVEKEGISYYSIAKQIDTVTTINQIAIKKSNETIPLCSEEIDSERTETIYEYQVNEGTLVFEQDITVQEMIENWNQRINEELEWVQDENAFRIRIRQKEAPGDVPSIHQDVHEHASGIEGDTVYINDLESDYNYYMGLNYTGSGNTLPTMDNKKTYSDNNLVRVQITYSSIYNRNGATLKGTVSTTENQDKYVYYKMLVVNDNGTSSTTDDYVEIELIDNPFTNRPKDYGFNGWQTAYVGAEISYDNAYYLRYAKVPVTYTSNKPDDIVIDFNASWTEAHVRISNSNSTSNLTNAISAFEDKSIQERATTKTVQEPDYGNREDNDMGGYYFQQMVPYNTNYSAGTYDENGNKIAIATGQVNATSGLNLREGPGTNYNVVSGLSNRVTVNIYSDKVSGSGCSAGWYEISYGNTRGYGCSSYINNITHKACTTSNGCVTYTEVANGTKYDSNETYYHLVNGKMAELDPNTLPEHPIIGYHDVVYDLFASTDNMSGYFESVTLSRNASLAGYYDNGGVLHTSGTCTSASCTYYKLLQYYDENGNPNNFVSGRKYYYLVTRDTNLIILEANLTGGWTTHQTKPLTITSSYGGTLYNAQWNLSNTYLKANDDLGLDNLTIYSNRTPREENPANGTETARTFYGNWHNVKIGRGIKRTATNQINFISAIGGGNSNTGSTSNLTKYRFVVESGFYTTTSQACGSFSSSTRNAYIKGYAIYGNDYDRVNNNNDNLDVYYASSGSWGCYIHGSDRYDTAINQTYKSGRFGSAHPTTIPNNDSNNFTYGVYVGGRSYGRTQTTRRVTVEGGWIYNLIGSPLVDSDIANYNSSYIYMKGGEVEAIYGGAGVTETYGNRIIQVTDGTVNFSIFGGSNGITGSGSEGTLTGSPYIYIGGNATIGNATNVKNNSTLFGFEAGSVFGIGNGHEETATIGTANNSYIIIDGNAHILKNIYGGGNYGAVGIKSSASTSETKINILNGSIDGSIFGGGNRNGSGSDTKTAKITINMYDGKVNGSIYGGSNETGIIYGDVDLNHYGGIVQNDIYGGGYGGTTGSSGGTFIQNNVNIKIGDNSYDTSPTINGSVYGGSAFGTVNGISHTTTTSSHGVNVTINKGVVKNSVFGGGKGDSVYTPYVLGNIVVTINDGNIAKVFGGNDAAGKPNGKVEVYIRGGYIGNTFGGGNNSSVNDTFVYLMGGESTYVYGGSNASGNVRTATIQMTGGTMGSIFGGNNIGGTVQSTDVTIQGGTIITELYGGGNKVVTETTKVLLIDSNAEIPYVYGGGKAADAGTTNVTNRGAPVGSLYGGSNTAGTVTGSHVKIESGRMKNVLGGNNAGGTTETATIDISGGSIESVYGGGNEAASTTATITTTGGYIGNLFGGGNQAGITTTTVNVEGGIVGNVYGGSNQSGDVNHATVTSNVSASSTSQGTLTMDVSIAAEDQTETDEYKTKGTATITITNTGAEPIDRWNAILTFQDLTLANNASDTEVTVKNNLATFSETGKTEMHSIPVGGSYTFSFDFFTNLAKEEITTQGYVEGTTSSGQKTSFSYNSDYQIMNIYGGNNRGGTTEDPKVSIQSGKIQNVYGGGNRADVLKTNVRVTGGEIDNLYGGGNEAGVTSDTEVNTTGGTIYHNLYGGGNNGTVDGNSEVDLLDTTIYGSAYAGGNGATAIVKGNTKIHVEGTTTVGQESSVAPKEGCVFGGGNAAATGQEDDKTSTATVDISGGSIYGNVYGGANTSVVYGKTEMNIGTKAVSKAGMKVGDIFIRGTIFGGGEANADGREDYDFSFIGVTDGIKVTINGEGHQNLHMTGSIFGSGNASSTEGISTIDILNYGNKNDIEKNISIQRTNTLTISNSYLELSGATDRTNDYSSVLFSLSRIDELKLANNSAIFLQKNANLLQKFTSVKIEGGKEELAEVTIDEATKSVVKNVNNCLFMMEGQNLNVATNQNATSYGEVKGMTFFGMYELNRNGVPQIGLYNPQYGYGDTFTSSDRYLFAKGSYVIGLHATNHDITKDGFYSNFDDGTGTNKIAYIDPTPKDSTFYMWIIGEVVTEYNIDLAASKYATLGTVELSLLEFFQGNTSFVLLDFNENGLKEGIVLKEKNQIPRVAADENTADTTMALVMESSKTGWITNGETEFLTTGSEEIKGTTTYTSENSNVVPSLMFYLYHSKNLGTDGDMGTVSISMMAITRIDDLTNETKRIIINVNLSRILYDTNDYEGAMTPGREYEMFASETTNITSKSSLSAYYSLFVETPKTIYREGYHRALTSTYLLPIGTQLTMIDLSGNRLQYYYHVIDEEDYAKAQQEYALYQECSYNFSLFQTMGTTSGTSKYDDVAMNEEYFDKENQTASEEFIFIVDFKNAGIDADSLMNKLLIELRDDEDQTIITVLGIEHEQLQYNIYANQDTLIELDASIDPDVIYKEHQGNLVVNTNLIQNSVGSDKINDTNYFDHQLGLKLTILDKDGEVVTGSTLLGFYYEIDGEKYYPNLDGTTRINIAERVANVESRIKLCTENANIPTGTYKVKIESFSSPDGIYFGLIPSDTIEVPFNFVNKIFGLKVTMPEDQVVYDAASGTNSVGTNDVTYQIEYSSGLGNPNIRIQWYRRTYEEIYSTTYEEADFQEYVSDILTPSENALEYKLLDTPQEQNEVNFHFNSNLKTGTYKLVFRLYDNDVYIGDIEKYIIID